MAQTPSDQRAVILSTASAAAPPLRVLYATDGSEEAATAGALLQRLPLPAGSTIRILTVVSGLDWHLPEPVRRAELEWATRTAEAAGAPLRRAGVAVVPEARMGAAAAEILAAAEEEPVDLLLLGSHGLSGLGEFLLGSVSRNVAKHAPIPVLVARPLRHDLRHVVAAVDGSEHAAEAVELLARLPLPPECRITLCHVTRPYYPYVALTPEYLGMLEEITVEVQQQQRLEAVELLHRAAQPLARAGRKPACVVREGDPAHELLQLAQEGKADLVVAGARGASLIEGLVLGSVADRLLKTAEHSVLLVRRREPKREEAEDPQESEAASEDGGAEMTRLAA
ncbi:MAG: universal stress protein [Armatimonadota bacterium]